MKKVILIVGLLLGCSTPHNVIQTRPTLNNAIDNLEHMVLWINYDVENSNISPATANNYTLLLDITINTLNKIKEND